MKELDWTDLLQNDEPVCPYCGEVWTDAWELNLCRDDQSTVTECYGCEREFSVTLNVSYTYTTRKPGLLG